MRSSYMLVILLLSIITVILAGIASRGVNQRYKKEVKTALGFWAQENSEILTEADIEELPEPVKKYIRYSGAVGKPKVWNFRVEMTGRMRNDQNSGWMKIKSFQYNFIKSPVRLFYIEGSMSGIPVYGIHAYKNEEGIMNIRILGLISVVNQSGKEMDISDTVTFFNDMCLFAPATLIDHRITWEPIDDLTTKAIFTNGSQKAAATLYFNESGELVNFISDDRYRIDKIAENLTWSTPVSEYKNHDSVNIMGKGSACWHYEDHSFSYAELDVEKVEYNIPDLRQ